jgi:hypothetical protein
MKYTYFIDNKEVDLSTFEVKLQKEMESQVELAFNELLDKRPFSFEGKEYKYSEAWKSLNDEQYWANYKVFRIQEIMRKILKMQRDSSVELIGFHKFQVSKGGI